MASDINTVVKLLRNTSTKGIELYSVIGTAVNIRASENLIDIVPISGAKIADVLINPVIDSTLGLKLIPKENSIVIATFTSKQNAYLAMCSELEEINVEIGNSKVQVTDSEILFNEGTNDGLINIKDLVTKLNNVENDLNILKSVFSSWVVAPTDGGGALKIAAAAWYAAMLTPTVQANLEDTKIKH